MKKSKIFIIIFCILFLVAGLYGCATTAGKAFESKESQVKLRSIQQRAFDTNDKKKMMQTIISTMQDLDFVINDADVMLGSVTGSKYLGNAVINMTVIVRPRGETQLLVRANAQYGITTIEDAATYQDFFIALEKALFLTAQQVD